MQAHGFGSFLGFCSKLCALRLYLGLQGLFPVGFKGLCCRLQKAFSSLYALNVFSVGWEAWGFCFRALDLGVLGRFTALSLGEALNVKEDASTGRLPALSIEPKTTKQPYTPHPQSKHKAKLN